MALTERLAILIDANGAAAVNEFSKVGKAAQTSLGSVQALGQAMTRVGAAGLGIGGSLVAVSAGDVQSLNQLKGAVLAAGDSFDDYEDAIDKAVSKNLGFAIASEDTNKGLQKLTEATGSTAKALQYIGVATDLAASRGIGLAEAADQVAKVLNGKGARALAAYGISVKENADGTKDYAGAVDELGRKVNGQAAASVEGFAGKLKVVKTQIEEQVQQFGAKYGPAITAASAASLVFGQVTEGLAAISARRSAALVAETAALEADTAAQVANNSAKVGGAGAGAAAGLTGLTAALPAVGIIAGMYGVSKALEGVFNDAVDTDAIFKKLADTADSELVPAFNNLASGTFFGDKAAAFELIAKGDIDRARDLIGELDALGQNTSKYRRIVEEVTGTQYKAGKSTEELARYYSALSAHYREANDAGQNLIATQAGLTTMRGNIFAGFEKRSNLIEAVQATNAVYEATVKATGASRNYRAEQHSLEQATKGVTDAQEQLAEAELALFLARLGPSTRDVADAELDRADAALNLRDAQNQVADAQRALNDARKDGDPEDIRDATRDLERANLNLRRSQLGNEDAQKAYNDTLNSGAESSDKVKDANDKLTEAQDRLKEAQFSAEEAQRRITEGVSAGGTAAETAGGKVDTAALAWQAYAQFLIDSGAPQEEINQALGRAVGEVDKLNQKFGDQNPILAERLRLLKELANFEDANEVAFATSAGGQNIVIRNRDIPGYKAPYDLSTGSGLSASGMSSGTTVQHTTQVVIDKQVVGKAYEEYSVDVGGSPAWIRPPN